MRDYVDINSRLGEGRPFESRPVDAALREMDDAGIALSWVHPTDRFAAVCNREGNDFLVAAVRGHRDRFLGCAVANPWSGKAAADELRRAFGNGLRALFLNPPVQGFQLDDDLVDPLIAVATEFKAPVVAHTGTPVCAMPLQLASLARRHAGARFIMVHMGFADFWYDAIPAATVSPNIWIETSMIDPDLLLDGISRLGADRLVFGTSAPFQSARTELAKIESMDLAPGEFEKVTRLNAEDLLR